MQHLVHVKGVEVSMFGRADEIKAIDARFENLLRDPAEGGMMLFTGDLGMGKSRICRFISEFAIDRSVHLVEGSGLDTETNTPYFPWRSVFAQLCDFYSNSSIEGKKEKLRKFLPDSMESMFPLFGKQLIINCKEYRKFPKNACMFIPPI